jgi:hypothetical protein
MTPRGKKQEPKLALELTFDDALTRFIQTKPKEVEQSIARAKQAKRKPPGRRKRRSGGTKRKRKA